MGKYYDESVIPVELRRDFDVYDRIKELGIDLGKRDELISLKGRNICGAIVHESGLVYLSGVGMGNMQMSDDPETVAHGQAAAAQCAHYHLRTLHWTLSCGGEGDLNDVLYTVKAIGMVVSTDVAFNSGPAVTNGYTKVWQDVFGGAIGHYAQDGADASYSGVHARSAIGGFTGRFSLEPEMIVAIPPTLSRDIITNRGWVFPLIPSMYDKVLGK